MLSMIEQVRERPNQYPIGPLLAQPPRKSEDEIKKRGK
jgi:hypothetical protein